MEMNKEAEQTKKSAMAWSDEKDLTMLKEVAAEGVLQHKAKSRERGACWSTVASNLNPMPEFEVTARSVRDHFNNLAKKHKVKMAKEERATGGGGESLTEGENLLEELIVVSEETEKRSEDENEKKKNNFEKEKAQALEMRKRAMETMGETKRRSADQEDAGKETLDWLVEHTEMARQMKEQERNEKKEERQAEKDQQAEFRQQLQLSQQKQNAQYKLSEQHLLSQLQQQQQQQQQQNQQFAMVQQQMLIMMQQQQKQTEMLAQLFKNSKN